MLHYHSKFETIEGLFKLIQYIHLYTSMNVVNQNTGRAHTTQPLYSEHRYNG